MKLIYLSYRNMVSKPLNLAMSLLLLLLSVGLVTFSVQFSEQLEAQLSKNIAPFDMVVGAKGSPLQLVLSSILHIDNPTGNIRLKETKKLQNHPFVKVAVPVSYGDSYKGYRILGTIPSYLSHYGVKINQGKLNETSFEVVAGFKVAQALDLKIGDSFVSAHGLVDAGTHSHDEHPFKIVGILEASGTVVDQLLITNLESIWEAHGHIEEAPKNEEQEEKEITSLLVKFKNPMGMIQLPRSINEDTSMQAALPGYEIQRLVGLLGSGVQTIHGIALAIFLVSGLSIFISLLKTIRERKRELALLRTYGLQKGQLLSLALMEGLFLALLGYLLGWFLGRVGIWGISYYTQTQFGYQLNLTGPSPMEFILLVLILALAVFASLLASVSIFKLNVVKTLSDA